MNSLTVTKTEGQRMTSIEVADLTGKRHDHVMRDIKVLAEQGAINPPNFGEIAYTDSRNREQVMYSLDFKASMVLVTGYDAVKRAAVIDRWVALETGEAKPAMIPTIKTSHGLLEVDKAFRAALRMAKAIGLKDNAAIFSANRLARKVTGSDTLQLLEVKALETTIDNQPFTPTQIGSTMGLSGRAVNELLEKEQFQTRLKTTKGITWTPTAKGAKHAHLEDTGKEHSDGSPVCQLKWKKTILEELNTSKMAIN